MKRIIWVCLVIGVVFILVACQKSNDFTRKIRDIDYTVVGEDKIPKELKQAMKEKEEKGFKLSYVDGENMYIAIGYGEKSTGGYSISVNQLYQTQNGIFFDTTLKGPGSNQVLAQSSSFPYLVVKLEYVEGSVIFN